MNADIWRHLGIPQTESEVEVRRAYAERLKVTSPDYSLLSLKECGERGARR